MSTDEHNPGEFGAVEAGLDTLGRAARDEPRAGFEGRIASAAARAARGEEPLRLVGHEGDGVDAAGERVPGRRLVGSGMMWRARVRRAGLLAACVAMSLVVVMAMRWGGLGGMGGPGVGSGEMRSLADEGGGAMAEGGDRALRVAMVSEEDFEEIATAWELLHDGAMAGLFDELQSETTMLERSMETAWSASWSASTSGDGLLGEDSL